MKKAILKDTPSFGPIFLGDHNIPHAQVTKPIHITSILIVFLFREIFFDFIWTNIIYNISIIGCTLIRKTMISTLIMGIQ